MSHENHQHECCEHEHEHEHHHEHSLSKQLWLIGITVILLIMAVAVEKTLDLPKWQLLMVYLVPYLLIGHDTLKEAVEGLTEGEAFNEHFLMSIATIGALCIGFLPGAETEFPEAVFVMLFFQVGELFEGYAEGKSRESIAHLMDIRPDVAHVETSTGLKDVSPEEVQIDEVIVIRPGEKVPLDGFIVEGSTSLNTVALTGETLPREVTETDEVISGCVNISGVIRVQVTKTFGESRSHSDTPGRFVCHMALSSPHVPRCQLSMCAGHQCAPHLFRGHRRSFQKGNTHQGIELYGHPRQGGNRRLRQDRYPDSRAVCRRGCTP